MNSEKQVAQLRKRLEKEGRIKIRLISNSMAPLLPTGAEAEIESCKFDDLNERDLVVFHMDDKLICHCVWGVGVFRSANGERTLVTRGLQNPFFDDPVRESWLVGRVTSHRLSKFRFYQLALSSRLFGRFRRM